MELVLSLYVCAVYRFVASRFYCFDLLSYRALLFLVIFSIITRVSSMSWVMSFVIVCITSFTQLICVNLASTLLYSPLCCRVLVITCFLSYSLLRVVIHFVHLLSIFSLFFCL